MHEPEQILRCKLAYHQLFLYKFCRSHAQSQGVHSISTSIMGANENVDDLTALLSCFLPLQLHAQQHTLSVARLTTSSSTVQQAVCMKDGSLPKG